MARKFDWRRVGFGLGRGLETFGRVSLAREEDKRRRREKAEDKTRRENIRQEDITRRDKERTEDKSERESYRRQLRIDALGGEIRHKEQRQIELQGAAAEKRISERKTAKKEQAALLRDPKYLYHLWLTNPADARISPAYRKTFESTSRESAEGKGGGKGLSDKDIFTGWNKLDPRIQEEKYGNSIGVYKNELLRELQTKENAGGVPGEDERTLPSPGVNDAATTGVVNQPNNIPDGMYNQVVGGIYDKIPETIGDISRHDSPESRAKSADEIDKTMADWEAGIDFEGEPPLEVGPGIKIIQGPDGPKVDITEAVETDKENADPNYLSPQKAHMLDLLKLWSSGGELTPQQQMVLDSLLLRYAQ